MVSPIPRDDVIADIQRVAEELSETPSLTQYVEHGEYSKSLIYRKFDGFKDARREAGLDATDQRGRQNRISREELLQAIHALRDELGRPPRRTEMLEQGKYSENPFRRVFGSWGEAVTEAGYEPYRPGSDLAERTTVTCEQCADTDKVLASQIENQEHWFCSRECKHQWQAENIVGEAHHQYEKETVQCEWCDADIEKKPAEIRSKERLFCDHECYSEWCTHVRVGEKHPRFKGGGSLYYGPNWQRQRRRRLEHDDFQCRLCGLDIDESKDEFGRELEVHHRKPVREFHNEQDDIDWGEVNGLDNLVTLCLPCHRMVESLPIQPEFNL